MSSLHLAFYAARTGRWLDRLVARHDGGPFSHVELVFDLDRNPSAAAICFSSSWRDGGVRFKRIRLARVPGRWRLISITATPRQVQLVRSWCIRNQGGRYDVPGVLAFKLPLVRQRLNWWFCSEICTAALQQVGRLMDLVPHETTPNTLYRAVALRFTKAGAP